MELPLNDDQLFSLGNHLVNISNCAVQISWFSRIVHHPTSKPIDFPLTPECLVGNKSMKTVLGKFNDFSDFISEYNIVWGLWDNR